MLHESLLGSAPPTEAREGLPALLVNKKGRLFGRPLMNTILCLCGLYILGLPSLGALDHIELHLLTFLQAAESAGLNG